MKKKLLSVIATAALCSTLIFAGQANNNVSLFPNTKVTPAATDSSSLSTKLSYTPAQVRHAYGLDNITSTGKNQKIAIIDAFGSSTVQSDLNTFCSTYGLCTANLKIIYPYGSINTKGFSSTTLNNWKLETSADVEWAHALAPDASIYLIIVPTNGPSDLIAGIKYASTLGVQAVSMSWGMSEFLYETKWDAYFSGNTTTYIASSGDNGATSTQWPAASPKVLAVGGTSLTLDQTGNLTSSETAWSSSGGGISRIELQPSYQTNIGISSNNHRAYPDVSFLANPNTGVKIYCNGSWSVVGGTSIGAPCMAGFVTLVDENRSTALTTDQLKDKLYSLSKNSSTYNSTFRDITAGKNSKYSAAQGYDFVTGLGSPKFDALSDSLAN